MNFGFLGDIFFGRYKKRRRGRNMAVKSGAEQRRNKLTAEMIRRWVPVLHDEALPAYVREAAYQQLRTVIRDQDLEFKLKGELYGYLQQIAGYVKVRNEEFEEYAAYAEVVEQAVREYITGPEVVAALGLEDEQLVALVGGGAFKRARIAMFRAKERAIDPGFTKHYVPMLTCIRKAGLSLESSDRELAECLSTYVEHSGTREGTGSMVGKAVKKPMQAVYQIKRMVIGRGHGFTRLAEEVATLAYNRGVDVDVPAVCERIAELFAAEERRAEYGINERDMVVYEGYLLSDDSALALNPKEVVLVDGVDPYERLHALGSKAQSSLAKLRGVVAQVFDAYVKSSEDSELVGNTRAEKSTVAATAAERPVASKKDRPDRLSQKTKDFPNVLAGDETKQKSRQSKRGGRKTELEA